MFHISFSPQRRDDTLEITKKGESLIINGTVYDFSPLEEGDVLPKQAVDCELINSDVVLQDSVYKLTLILPHGPDASERAKFPEDIQVSNDGDVEIPK